MTDVELFEAWLRLTSALVDGWVTAEEYNERLAELKGSRVRANRKL
jgi:hypothetical protein